MHKKKTLLLLLALLSIIFLIIKCDDDDGYVDEGGFEITGLVLDSISQLPIQGVSVGFNSFDVPDSLLLVGDSINTNYLYPHLTTNDLGKFRYSTIGYFSIQEFQKMLAWKTEYKLWRFVYSPVPIVETQTQRFQLTIYLSHK